MAAPRPVQETPDPHEFGDEDDEVIYMLPNRHDDGWTYYFSEEAVQAAITPEDIEYALGAVGAWSDLDWDEMLDALDEIRHRNPPSPPVTHETLGLK